MSTILKALQQLEQDKAREVESAEALQHRIAAAEARSAPRAPAPPRSIDAGFALALAGIFCAGVALAFWWSRLPASQVTPPAPVAAAPRVAAATATPPQREPGNDRAPAVVAAFGDPDRVSGTSPGSAELVAAESAVVQAAEPAAEVALTPTRSRVRASATAAPEAVPQLAATPSERLVVPEPPPAVAPLRVASKPAAQAAPKPAAKPAPVRIAKPVVAAKPKPKPRPRRAPAAPGVAVARTVWHPDPARRTAVIRMDGWGEIDVVEGDWVGQLEVLEIKPAGVVVEQDGRRVEKRIGR